MGDSNNKRYYMKDPLHPYYRIRKDIQIRLPIL